MFPTGRRDGPSSYLHGLCFMACSRASALSIFGRLLPAGAAGFGSFAPGGRRPIHPKMLMARSPLLPDSWPDRSRRPSASCCGIEPIYSNGPQTCPLSATMLKLGIREWASSRAPLTPGPKVGADFCKVLLDTAHRDQRVPRIWSRFRGNPGARVKRRMPR